MKKDLSPEILELIRLTSTDLPGPVEKRLRAAKAAEEDGSAARHALDAILTNVEISRRDSTPICQDTGTPIFFVRLPREIPPGDLVEQIRAAVGQATRRNYLRPNAVEPLTGKNTGDNLGDEYYPSIHFTQGEDDTLTIDLILKGGGCENVGAQYSLPEPSLKAGRDLEGVRRAVLDAVHKAQGEGCAPGFLGVAIGGDRGTSYAASKQVFLRDLDDESPDTRLARLEERITREANELGIGPMGFGGKATVLGTKITATHRIPASYFVTISYMCWAYRRRRMIVTGDEVTYR